MPRLALFAACWLIAAFAASPLSAQVLPRPQLTPVDPVAEDVNPLSTSLRTMALGLQQPVEFDEVYRMRGVEGKFVRVHGGLYAVFDQSAYHAFRGGAIPVIPAGTTFYIGDPTRETYRPNYGPFESPPVVTGEPLAMRLDTRIIVQADPPAEGTSSADPAGEAPGGRRSAQRDGEPLPSPPLDVPGTIFGDEAYRGGRVLELLQRAAAAEREAPTAADPA